LFQEAGRSKIPRLTFGRRGFCDTLAALEFWRKRQLLKHSPAAAQAVDRLEDALASHEDVASVSLVQPERNLRLRRLEPLVLTRPRDREEADRTSIRVARQIAALETETSLRIDPWIASTEQFADPLTAPRPTRHPASSTPRLASRTPRPSGGSSPRGFHRIR
jgi:hypothetical protein